MRKACPTCGCKMYNETGQCSGELQLTTANKRIAELEDAQRGHGVAKMFHEAKIREFQEHHDTCQRIVDASNALVDSLQARIDAAVTYGKNTLRFNYPNNDAVRFTVQEVTKFLTSDEPKAPAVRLRKPCDCEYDFQISYTSSEPQGKGGG